MAKHQVLHSPSAEAEAFYSFLLAWLEELLDKPRQSGFPIVVGLSAPQGAGKTTLTRRLCELLSERSTTAVSVSIDDFYLTRRHQIELARRHSDNPYLQHRGYPGTHDIDLGTRTLTALRDIESIGEVAIPSYDRTAFSGIGDRRPRSAWPIAKAPLDLVILEGWMLGFTPVLSETLPNPHLRLVNEYLGAYSAWHDRLDAFIWLEPEDPSFTVEWRVEAEERSKAEGKVGMSRDGIEAFAVTFLPAYSIYLPQLAAHQPLSGPFLHRVIGRHRLPI